MPKRNTSVELINSTDSVVYRRVTLRVWHRLYRVEIAALPQSDQWHITDIYDVEDRMFLQEGTPMHHEVEIAFNEEFTNPHKVRELVQQNAYAA